MNPWLEIQQLADSHNWTIIGVDEAGRGPLLGPVFAGAACLLDAARLKGLACSKTLSEARRNSLFDAMQSGASQHAVAYATVEEIDRFNILQASLMAMHRAVDLLVDSANLDVDQVLVIVDGNRLPKWRYRARSVVKGDQWVPAVSAGSVLAKVSRDQWCAEMAPIWPQYEIDKHMGYPTPRHLELLKLHGPTPLHRKSFGPVRRMLEIAQSELFK